ncbi:SCO2400 family protein [Streptomyces sp. NBC_01235]|uniref:SCO2400 family protein n=1 Tax=Streptomyces sp. NBC_01235 TaxID=2903788 RepID=UPI002E13D0DA|nr:hypothetical protein OG289_26890 [Streptomyces sp. NBC_01235]
MDYCSTCRRHLNGALVCPGCGAYAPDIAPRIIAPRNLDEPSPAPLGSRYSPESPDSPDLASDSPELASVVPPVPLPAPQGRAARRRQLARWKKNQRRAVVATAVALVGGGLTIASLDRQTGDRTQAATAPERPTTYGGEEPASDHTRPTVTGSEAHRSKRSSTPPAQSPANTHPDDLASTPTPPATPTAPSVPRQRTGSSSYDAPVTTPTAPTDEAGTTDQQTPAPAATDGTESSSSTSNSSSSSSQTSPAPAATSPSDICLLGLVCL